MLAGILIALFILIFFGGFGFMAALDEGWSPSKAWDDHKARKMKREKQKKLQELELRRMDLELREREEALLNRQLGL